MSARRVCLIVGTRPEAIKLAPVVAALHATDGVLVPLVVTTGQHREMVDRALQSFGVRADVALDVPTAPGGVGAMFDRIAASLRGCFEEMRPSAVLVQGDTTSAAAAALSAYGSSLLIGHVEAGLRSGALESPFPEELNRRMISCVADLHFAPTRGAAVNLLREGVRRADIRVTGNTVVDALRSISRPARFTERGLSEVEWSTRRVLLVTVHRRESWGRLPALCDAVATIAERFPDVEVVLPVHPNPAVARVVHERLASIPRVRLLPPLDYGDLVEVLRRCHLVLSDSGGLQEEAPSFGKPVLILRDRTERPELVEAGLGIVVGTGTERIVAEATRLLAFRAEYEAMCRGRNPFGDGRAAMRIAAALRRRLTSRVAVPRPARIARRPMLAAAHS
jgi:UDP-N-acetylglucosamine 2-epimerase (non-hydrolysing)